MTTHTPVTTTIRPLQPEEIYAIYTTHSVRHFPDSERKPLASIQRMIAEGIYHGYGLFSPCQSDPADRPHLEQEQLIGYAFCTMPPCCDYFLLDYFAILEEYRSMGVGSLLLRQLKSLLNNTKNGILIESEDPDHSNDIEETTQQWRRIAFYEKNHAVDTGLRAEVFHVPYRVLCLPFSSMPSQEAVHTDFQQIYRHMVSPEQFTKYILIHS